MGLNSYTSPIKAGDVEKIRALLELGGFDFTSKPYAHFSAKKGKLNVTVYEKGPSREKIQKTLSALLWNLKF